MTNDSSAGWDFDDLPERTLPIKYKGKTYVLHEASGEAATKYRNASIHAATFGENGKPVSFKNLADAEPILVGECLFEVGKDGNELDKPVGAAKIKSIFPARRQKEMYNWIKENSLLEEKETKVALFEQIEKLQKRIRELDAEEDKVKNLQSGTGDGSASLES